MRVWLFIERPSANPRKSQPIASRNLALILPLVGFVAHRHRSARCWTRASALAAWFEETQGMRRYEIHALPVNLLFSMLMLLYGGFGKSC